MPAASATPPAPCFTEPAYRFCVDGSTSAPCTNQNMKPYGLAVGDVAGLQSNGQPNSPDGWLDVVVANLEPWSVGSTYGHWVTVFTNTKSWTNPNNGLLITHQLSVDGSPHDVKIVDMNKDGYNDIVVSMSYSESTNYTAAVAIFLYDGNSSVPGQFQSPVYVELEYDDGVNEPDIDGINALSSDRLPLPLAVADFDNQNGPDIAVAGGYAPSTLVYPRVVILKRSSSATLDFPVSLRSYYDPPSPMSGLSSIVASRFKCAAAQYPDLVAAGLSPHLFVMWNNSGSWITEVQQYKSAYTYGLAAGQFKVGSIRDLAISDYADRYFIPCLNTEDCAQPDFPHPFERQSPIGPFPSWLDQPYGCATGLLNDDNTVDVAIACAGNSQSPHGGVAVIVGNGDGTFVSTVYGFEVDPNAGNGGKGRFVEVGDLNKDGYADIAVTCYDSGKLGILLQIITCP